MFKLLVSFFIVLLTLIVIIIEPKMHKPVVFGSKPIIAEPQNIETKNAPIKVKPQDTNLVREEYMKSVKMKTKQPDVEIAVEPQVTPQVSQPIRIKQKIQTPEPQMSVDEIPETSFNAISEMIQWNKWRADICNTISDNSLEEQVYHLKKGVMFKYTFNVDNHKHITNINVYLARGQSDAVVRDSIRDIRKTIMSLEGKNILTYPAGSRRTNVRVEGGIEMSSYDASISPGYFSDVEFK